MIAVWLVGALEGVWMLFGSPTATDQIYTQRNFCCMSKSTMKHQKKLDLPRCSNDYWTCMSVDSLTAYQGPPNCALLNVE